MWAGTLLCVPDSLFYEWFSSQPGVIVYFSKSLNYWFTWQPLKPESDLFKNKHNIRLCAEIIWSIFVSLRVWLQLHNFVSEQFALCPLF